MLSSGSLTSCGRDSSRYLRTHSAARSPSGIMRSFCPLPWRMVTVRALEIEIPELQMRQLQTPHAGRVERFEDGAIAQAQRIVRHWSAR